VVDQSGLVISCDIPVTINPTFLFSYSFGKISSLILNISPIVTPPIPSKEISNDTGIIAL